MHKFLGAWFREHTDVRDAFTGNVPLTIPFCRTIVDDLEAAVRAGPRDYPVPRVSDRQAARLARQAAVAGALSEQARQAAALAALPSAAAAPPDSGACAASAKDRNDADAVVPSTSPSFARGRIASADRDASLLEDSCAERASKQARVCAGC